MQRLLVLLADTFLAIPAAHAETIKINIASCCVTEDATTKEILPAFRKHYKEKFGKEVDVSASFAGSGTTTEADRGETVEGLHRRGRARERRKGGKCRRLEPSAEGRDPCHLHGSRTGRGYRRWSRRSGVFARYPVRHRGKRGSP